MKNTVFFPAKYSLHPIALLGLIILLEESSATSCTAGCGSL
jgi:hypothetical protein